MKSWHCLFRRLNLLRVPDCPHAASCPHQNPCQLNLIRIGVIVQWLWLPPLLLALSLLLLPMVTTSAQGEATDIRLDVHEKQIAQLQADKLAERVTRLEQQMSDYIKHADETAARLERWMMAMVAALIGSMGHNKYQSARMRRSLHDVTNLMQIDIAKKNLGSS